MAYVVEVGAPAKLYARDVPTDAIAVGIVRIETGETGALLRFRSGAYAQMNGDTVRPLDRREVLRAMQERFAIRSARSMRAHDSEEHLDIRIPPPRPRHRRLRWQALHVHARVPGCMRWQALRLRGVYAVVARIGLDAVLSRTRDYLGMRRGA